MIFQAGPTRVIVDAQEPRHRRRVHPHAPRRAGRLRPPPPRAGARDRVRHQVRPRPARHRPGPRPVVDRPRQRGHRGGQVQAQGRRGHVRDRPARRLRHRRRSHRGRDRGPGHRRGAALRLRRGRVPARHGPLGAALARDPRRARAQVPLDHALHRRAQGAPPPPGGDAGGGAQHELRRVRDPLHPDRGHGRVEPLPAVHLRGDRLLRPAQSRAWSTGRRSKRWSRATTKAPASGA